MTMGSTTQLGRLDGRGPSELGQSGAHVATHRTHPPAPCPRGGDRGAASGPSPVEPASELLEVAATILALAAIGQGQLRSEADERIVDLERAVLAAVVRGRLDAWDREMVDPTLFASPARGLVWLCACRVVDALGPELRTARVRPRPWDAVRLALVSVPRGGLELEAFASLLAGALAEVDAAEHVPRLAHIASPLEQLLAERRRQATHAALLPIVAALDAGAPLEDTSIRLREAADLFGELAPASRRKAA